ncbi:MAG: phospholipase [Cytophagaceae bacterium]|nr:phospholipase [Cytophagaceae bacterium]
MKIKNLSKIPVLLLFFWIISCKNNDPEPADQYLVSFEQVAEISKSKFQSEITSVFGAQSASIALFIQSGMKTYRLKYNTKTPEGDAIIASGAVIVPTDLTTAYPMLGYQHGTIFEENKAPSYFNSSSESYLGMFFSSIGYLVAMPDYLGYGESKSYPHPYEHKDGLAKPNVDFLLAVKEMAKKLDLNWNQNLMLAGYSEGGYATLATQKLIEEQYASVFNLKASSCGAGAYNKIQTVKNFLTQKTNGDAGNNRSYLWVMLTYDRLYKINKPLSDYFAAAYVSEISDKKHLVSISKPFDEILNPAFKQAILTNGDAKWTQAMADNDIFDWKVKTPTRLYHGDKDPYVPYLNSSTAAAAMKAKGSTAVELITVTGGTHDSSVSTFVLGTMDFFGKYKN